MSHIRMVLYSFECDVPGCDVIEDVGPGVTLRQARAELRFHGWTRSNEQDVCPRHSGTERG